MMPFRVALRSAALAFLALLPAGTVADPQGTDRSVQAIVDQFYPRVEPQHPDPQDDQGPAPRLSAYAVYDRFADGAPRTIMAAYCGAAEAIRVIRADEARAYSVVNEPANLGLSGQPLHTANCQIELVDADFDSVNEVFVSFAAYETATGAWLFRWDGAQLKSLGPTEFAGGRQESSVGRAYLADLCHSGPLYLIAPTLNQDAAVYRLAEGRYTFDRQVLRLASFEKRRSQPETWSDYFFFREGLPGLQSLKIINGSRDGSRRVSVRVVLNGAEVIPPGYVSPQVEFLTTSVSLQHENSIQVTLDGDADGYVLVLVESQAAPACASLRGARPSGMAASIPLPLIGVFSLTLLKWLP